MKKVILVHGWDGSPKEPMHKWIKKQAESLGFEVIVPQMPNPEKPQINAWTEKLKEVSGNPDEDTIIIGHSMGCQAVLRYIETLPKSVKIGKCILLAPWMKLNEATIKEEGEEALEIAKPWMETPIDWKKIKSHCDNFICIFSDNDPYVSLTNQEIFRERLNPQILILKNRYHFDPGNNIKKLPEILKFLK